MPPLAPDMQQFILQKSSTNQPRALEWICHPFILFLDFQSSAKPLTCTALGGKTIKIHKS
jgi:hypothetical protein